jgi:hypothetical protein
MFMDKVLKTYILLTEIKTRTQKNYEKSYLIVSLGLILYMFLFFDDFWAVILQILM